MSSDDDQGFSWGGGGEVEATEPCPHCDEALRDEKSHCPYCGRELGTLSTLMDEPVWFAVFAIAGCAAVVALAMR